MNKSKRIEQIISVTVIVLLISGCLMVLRPFIISILWGGVLAYSLWPVYFRLNLILGKKKTISALLMILITAAILITPFTLVVVSLSENMQYFTDLISKNWDVVYKQLVLWIRNIPSIKWFIDPDSPDWSAHGTMIMELFKTVLSQRHVQAFFGKISLSLAKGIIELALSVFITFFFFRNGEEVIDIISKGVNKITGNQTHHYLNAVGRTVKSVVYGIIGTAIIQGILASLGFYIAGIPSSMMLGLFTFIIAIIIPAGPMLLWIPCAIWLFFQGNTGYGIFMVVYGFFIISGVDNVLRPYLISRESKMPFVLIFFGVIGGLMAFGFIGLFLGPTLLVIGHTLVMEWISLKNVEIPGPLETVQDSNVVDKTNL